MRIALVAAMLALVAALLVSGKAFSVGDQVNAATSPTSVRPVVIRSRNDLDAYLRTTAGAGSPINRLSPRARARFLSSLTFNQKGLTGFRYDDLRAELMPSQISHILRLFGLQADTSITGDRVASTQQRASVSSQLTAKPVGTKALSQADRIEMQFNTFDQLQSRFLKGDPPTHKIARLFGENYNELFSSVQSRNSVRKLNGSDIVLLFRAAGTALFYTYDSKYARDMQLDFNELQSRGLASQGQSNEMYDALVGSRMFSAARTLARTHPTANMPRVPEFHDSSDRIKSGPTEMLLSRDGRRLLRRSVNLRMPGQIIIVASPLCHFCQRAIRDIESDPGLREVFRNHTTWLVPPDASTSFYIIEQWNREHPHEVMKLAYKLQEWPMFDRWETPTFYFLGRNKVLAQVVGWPREGRKAEVRTALTRIGLLRPIGSNNTPKGNSRHRF